MLCLIDNYDSFTFNLVQYLDQLGSDTRVIKNDACLTEEIDVLAPDHIVLSPGPCTPSESGICWDTVKTLGHKYPILGVCLGHEVIGEVYGGTVRHAKEVMHGKTSRVFHDGKGVFTGLPSPIIAARYHSLVVDPATLPDCLEISAWTETADGELDEIMGVRHREYAVEGIQFHPESILSEYGHDILRNFLTGNVGNNPGQIIPSNGDHKEAIHGTSHT